MLHTRTIQLPYGAGTLSAEIPERNLLAVATPHDVDIPKDLDAELRRALEHPTGTPPLRQAARGARKVVLLADDLTRLTPVHRMIPVLLDELNAAGIRDAQIQVLIALGTHREMSEAEILARFGEQVVRRVEVLNHPWQDPAQLVDLGVTGNGTPVSIAQSAVEADFLIGLGSIVPHHIPGYSAGAKIVQPGISGAATTGATHYLSTRTRRSYLGMVENPVRAEMERIAERVGLRAILNVVLDRRGRLVQAFYGNPRQAFRAGVAACNQVYGVRLPGKADIVIANSHPCEIEFWQAHKSLYPADLAVKTGGTIIVTTPSPEGVSVMHPDLLEFTALPAETILARIEDGVIQNRVSGALALAWAKIRQRVEVMLVSDGISAAECRALGFTPQDSLPSALEAAFRQHGEQAQVNVLTHAPDTLPLLPASGR